LSNVGGLGMRHNSFTRENAWRMEHRYKWQQLVHLGDKLWSLDSTAVPWRPTHASTSLYE